MKIYICVFFENLSRKFKFHKNRTRITGPLYGHEYTFMIIFRIVLFRMRNVLDINGKENQHTHFIFLGVFIKILPFMRKFEKILYSRTGQK
jgi:hypothetical protein